MEEIEVKFLNIDVADMEARLTKMGAKKIGEHFYKRRVFDYPDMRLNKMHAWVRLRDEGDKVTLTYKRRMGVTDSAGKKNDEGMEEVEIIVNDFEKTAHLLKAMGLIEKFYEENKRVRWGKAGVEFDIDTWPLLPSYLEIEAQSWAELDGAVKELGLNPDDKKIFSTHQVYRLNGIEEDDYAYLGFDKQIKK
jgi:adenylate cyclase class 2